LLLVLWEGCEDNDKVVDGIEIGLEYAFEGLESEYLTNNVRFYFDDLALAMFFIVGQARNVLI
jgi:hypothetical protein